MTIIDQAKYPYEVSLIFDSSEHGKKCFVKLIRAFRAYEEAQFHFEYDYRKIEFYLPTLDQKTRFEAQAKDITKRLTADSTASINTSSVFA